jgi:hypothetical protein
LLGLFQDGFVVFCDVFSVPRTMMNDSAKKSLAYRLHEDILLVGLLLDVRPLTSALDVSQNWLCHCGNKVRQVVEHCLPTNALTAILPPFPSPILA